MPTLSMISPCSLATTELQWHAEPTGSFSNVHDFRMPQENQASQNPHGPLRKKPGFHRFRDVKTEASSLGGVGDQSRKW